MAKQTLVEAQYEIIGQLDVAAIYTSWGLKLAGSPGNNGWQSAHIFGEEDRNPSAAINCGDKPELRGRYRNFITCETLSFFDAAVSFAGVFSDWQSARAHFAEMAGVVLPDDQNQADQLAWLPWDDNDALAYARGRKDGKRLVSKVLRISGARCAFYPKKMKKHSVFALPVCGKSEHDVLGHYFFNARPGKPISLWQKGAPDLLKKSLVTKNCPCGFINNYAWMNLDEAEVVVIVEGPPDMLAMQTEIGLAGKQKKHAVFATSHGTGMPSNQTLATLKGKKVVLVGDCDKPGQERVRKLAEALGYYCEVAIVTLPYDITEDHGKDCEDFFMDGNNYDDFFALKSEYAPITEGEAPSNPGSTGQMTPETALKELGISVLGRTPDGDIQLFNERNQQWELVGNIDRFGYMTFISFAGREALSVVVDAKEAQGDLVSWLGVRREIAAQASERRVNPDTFVEEGVWPFSDQLLIVGNDYAANWDGEVLTKIESPFYRDRVLKFGCNDNNEQWFDFATLQEDIFNAGDHKWCEEVINQVQAMIEPWNWKNKEIDPAVVTGMIIVTLVQKMMTWCPQLVILGKTSTGKSRLAEVLAKLFGKLGLNIEAQSTATGIRQKIGRSSRSVLIDEWDRAQPVERRKILDMMRAACRGSSRVTGTSRQKAIATASKQSFFALGITSNLSDEADINRFIQLQILKWDSTIENKFLPYHDDGDLSQLSRQLLAIAVRYGLAIANLARDIGQVEIEGLSARLVEGYAAPVAALCCAFGEPTIETAKRLIFNFTRDVDYEIQDDERNLIEAILSAAVTLRGKTGRRTIGQLIEDLKTTDFDEAQGALAGVGIRVDESNDLIFLQYGTILDHLLKGTPWEGQTIAEILLRIPGCSKKRTRIGGVNRIAVFMKFTQFNAMFVVDEEDEKTGSPNLTEDDF